MLINVTSSRSMLGQRLVSSLGFLRRLSLSIVINFLVLVASMGCQEDHLIEKVCEIYDQISRLDNLNPCENVNSLFTKLVLLCVPHCHVDVNKLSERVQEIRSKLIKLCGQAEGLLESHFSTLIGSNENPLEHISLFPYYTNYLKLSQLEFSMLSQNCSQVPKNVAFVGSGPLPLTSIILARNHLRTSLFHNYDFDSSANSKALQLVSSDPDLSKRMFFHTSNIMNLSASLKEYDAIFLAALVGMDKAEKVQVINHLAEHMAPGAILLLRSAHGARAFLYPVIDTCDLQGFEVLSVFHPTDEVINSVIIARRKCSTTIHTFDQGLAVPLPSAKCSDFEEFNPLKFGNMIEGLAIHEQQT